MIIKHFLNWDAHPSKPQTKVVLMLNGDWMRFSVIQWGCNWWKPMICMGDVWTINHKPENLKTNLPSLRENHIGSIMGAKKNDVRRWNGNKTDDWLVVWNMNELWLSHHIGKNNHPNWLSLIFFRGVGWNHQPNDFWGLINLNVLALFGI